MFIGLILFCLFAIFILRRTSRPRRLVHLRRLVGQYKQQVAIMSRFFLVKIKSSVQTPGQTEYFRRWN